MRLLDTATLEFREFIGSQIPCYAILSHTWGEEEVSYQDLRDSQFGSKAGFTKIKDCCTIAAGDGWSYVWIDTCCIDKTSSTELSEAINSMFDWYQEAAVCYAYLVDVPGSETNHADLASSFRKSRWFTRGWTLQELLAPSTLIFLNRDWKSVGTRSSLSSAISMVTGISLSDMANIKHVSIARKMSWMSTRQTTRVEDMAYCLIGLFEVKMPLLYGEGRYAFIRLQLKIISKSDDETIFAWDQCPVSGAGMLAPSPALFRSSGDIRQRSFDERRPPYSMTNKGLRMELLLWRQEQLETAQDQACGKHIYVVPLNCTRYNGDEPLCIFLKSATPTNDGIPYGYTRVPTQDYTRHRMQERTRNRGNHGLVRRLYPLQSFAKEFPKDFDLKIQHSIVFVKQFDWELELEYDAALVDPALDLLIEYPPSLCTFLVGNAGLGWSPLAKGDGYAGSYCIRLTTSAINTLIFQYHGQELAGRGTKDELCLEQSHQCPRHFSLQSELVQYFRNQWKDSTDPARVLIIYLGVSRSTLRIVSTHVTRNAVSGVSLPKLLESLVDSDRYEFRPGYKRRVQLDHVQSVLPGKKMVSISSKPIGIKGRKGYLLNVKIDPNDGSMTPTF